MGGRDLTSGIVKRLIVHGACQKRVGDESGDLISGRKYLDRMSPGTGWRE
jgi:hypothetical protein